MYKGSFTSNGVHKLNTIRDALLDDGKASDNLDNAVLNRPVLRQ